MLLTDTGRVAGRRHCGPNNRRLKLHLPLKVPKPDESGSGIGMRIGQAVRRWEASLPAPCHRRRSMRCMDLLGRLMSTRAWCLVSACVAHAKVDRRGGGRWSSQANGPDSCRPGSCPRGLRSWREGACNFLDDSFEHEVWNDSNETRVVLEVIFDHPDLERLRRGETPRPQPLVPAPPLSGLRRRAVEHV